ncbi:urea ABC transporter ATP-binding protein UrtD [Streptomyces sp. NBC_01506]|uniref:urea ABC transporter ATP-binding protein UrtD n=1 Tax=Streptomyces sp. NBC_01506 TaxID=2903887 RepID=UPI003863DA39
MTGTTAPDVLLSIRDLRVSFDGFTAVDGVDLDVARGDIRFLIGPNGAGKTTLVDAVTGLSPASGSVEFDGRQLLGRSVHRIARAGIGRTFQTATVFERLTVEQNLDIAAGAGRSALTLLRRRRSTPEGVLHALEEIGLTAQRDKLAGVLAHGQKQWLEIGMLLVQDARLLLLDEPVAGMSHDEREATGQLLQKVSRERTVVVIEHDMDFMRSFARTVSVLHAGRVLSEGTVAQVQADPKVQEVYLGHAPVTDADAAADAAPVPAPVSAQAPAAQEA